MNARSVPLHPGIDELEQVVADIRALGAGAALPTPTPTPTPAALAAAIAHLHDEQPLSGEMLEQREREWRAVEDELRTAEQDDARRDGRL